MRKLRVLFLAVFFVLSNYSSAAQAGITGMVERDLTFVVCPQGTVVQGSQCVASGQTSTQPAALRLVSSKPGMPNDGQSTSRITATFLDSSNNPLPFAGTIGFTATKGTLLASQCTTLPAQSSCYVDLKSSTAVEDAIITASFGSGSSAITSQPITVKFESPPVEDAQPPTITNPLPIGTITVSSATLQVTTDEPATCRYSTAPSTSPNAYDTMPASTTTGQSISHSWPLTGLTEGSKSYYVRCSDANSIKNTQDFQHTFTVQISAPPSTNQPSSITISSSKLELAANGQDTAAITATFLDSAGKIFPFAGTFDFTATKGTLIQNQCTTTASQSSCSVEFRSSAVVEDAEITAAWSGKTAKKTIAFKNPPSTDSQAPNIINPEPVAKVTAPSATLRAGTDEEATCRYSTAPSTSPNAYDTMPASTTTGQGKTHSWSLTGLSNGQKTYYIRCSDTLGNKNSQDFAHTFTVELDTKSPIIELSETAEVRLIDKSRGVVGKQPFSLVIETDEESKDCDIQFRQGAEQKTEKMNVLQNSDNKKHSLSINNLNENREENFKVGCKDLLNNPSSADLKITIDTVKPVIQRAFGLSWGTEKSFSEGENKKSFIIGNDPTEARIILTTDEDGRCKYREGGDWKNLDFIQASETRYDASTAFRKNHVSELVKFSQGANARYEISCHDRVGNEVQKTAFIEVKVDTTPRVNIISKRIYDKDLKDCAQGCRTTNITPIMYFETTDSASCTIYGDFPNSPPGTRKIAVSDGNKKRHSYPRFLEAPKTASNEWPGNLDFKEHKLEISCKDESGKKEDGTEIFAFTVEPKVVTPPVQEFIQLGEPKYGISKTYKFNIVIKTIENADCRWDFELNNAFMQMSPFHESNRKTHIIKNFEMIKQGDQSVHKLYVSCDVNNDGQGEDRRAVFDIGVDETAPVIEEVYTFPEPVADTDKIARLIVKTDELTICKYGETQNPAQPIGNSISRLHEDYITLAKEGENKYYIVCYDLVDLPSITKEITATYNPGLPFEMKTRTKEFFGPDEAPFFSIQTNKKAGCLYKRSDQNTYSQIGSPDSGYSHRVNFKMPQESGSLEQGKYTFNVVCTQNDGRDRKTADVTFSVDRTPPTMNYTDDTSALELSPEYSCYTNQLRVKWLGDDPDSGIKNYEYSIINKATNRAVKNGSDDEYSRKDNAGKWQIIRGLKLENRTSYYFSVKSYNMVNASSQGKASDGITVDSSKCDILRTCVPGTRGCPSSPCSLRGDCGEGTACEDDSSCKSGYCDANKKCSVPSCSDKVKDGAESDIDCGGSCGKCGMGKICSRNDDCSTGNCEFGKCREPDTCANKIRDGAEIDADCGGVCKPCDAGKSCSKDIDCGLGLECRENACIESASPEFLDRDKDSCPDEWEIRNGLDPTNENDCSSDSDDDLLSNLQEYEKGTNPLLKDTDKDGFSDGDEIKKGTDPLDPDSFPKSRFAFVVMLISGILLLTGGTGFLLYKKYGAEGMAGAASKIGLKKTEPAAQRAAQKDYREYTPKTGRKGHSAFIEKVRSREKEFKEAFKPFQTAAKQEPKKPAEKKPAAKKEDVFQKLSSIKGAKQGGKKEDVFEKLKGIGKDGRVKEKKDSFSELRKISKSRRQK